MTDRIKIADLRVLTRVGVPPDERATPQYVRITIEMELSLARAGSTDDVADTVDYGEITSSVAGLVGSMEVALLETIAARVATQIGGLSGVDRVTVEVTKERSPVPEEVGPISVRIERP